MTVPSRDPDAPRPSSQAGGDDAARPDAARRPGARVDARLPGSGHLPDLREERKVVSILCVDLVGFVARSDQADPEDIRTTLRPYYTCVRRELERWGGTVEKLIGDAVMAAFGAPVAHEDDAERAVRAALRVVEAVQELKESAPALGLAVRAAVTTGEAVVARGARTAGGEALATGDVVNTAARLQAIAPVGAVVVDEATYRTTRHLVDYEAFDPVALREQPGAVRVWQARAARSRYGADPVEPTPSPFVGRSHELALLKALYARAAREGSAQLVTVAGEPGVGKSRLVREFRAFVDWQPERARWRQGRCLPYGDGITFWALGEIVKSQAGILESDTPHEASAKLGAAVAAIMDESAERDWIRARLALLVGASAPAGAGPGDRTESFAAWRRFLEAVAADRPLVLVFEDMHWAGAALLEFVEYLVDSAAGLPLLVVCTTRPELFERHPGWGGGKRDSTTISLAPLSREETSRLITAHLSGAELPAEIQLALLERAGGNPLYAGEFARMLADRGIVERRGGAVQLAAGAEIPIPGTVHAVIAARLDTLPAERKALLHDAAVVGTVFWVGALASMSGLEEGAVEQGLRTVAGKELLRPARSSSVKGQVEYAFRHGLIRDVAYQQIPRAARVSKHRMAAAWIERLAGDRVTDHADILAHHYGQALQLARAAALDDATGELEDQLRRYLGMAGDRALELDARKAEGFYRRALTLCPPRHPDRARLLGKAAEAALTGGRLAEAQRDFEDAIGEFRARGDALGAGEAMVRLARTYWFRGETDRKRALLAQAIDLLEREPPGRELALAYAHTAADHMVANRSQECAAWSEKALALAQQLGLDAEAIRARQLRGLARCQTSDLAGGLADLREALRRSLDLGLGNETIRSYGNLGDWVWVAEGPGEGLALKRAGIEFGERRGLVLPVMWARTESLWPLFDLGRWDELLRIAGELTDWDRAQGGGQVTVVALTYTAYVLVCRGEVGRAHGLAQQFLPRAREIRDPQVLVPAGAVAALIEHRRGTHLAAVRLVEEIEEVTRDRPVFRSRHLPEALRVCAAAGAVRLAERLLDVPAHRAARHQCSVLAGRAVLAEARGRVAEAGALHGEAAERWADYGFALERGQAALGAGRCLLAVGRHGEAVARLLEARQAFDALGAAPLRAEADAALGRAERDAPDWPAPSPGRAPEPWDVSKGGAGGD
jgi:class 3 adenylate cyclase/tetratricopeptide (TPR) repeat protein